MKSNTAQLIIQITRILFDALIYGVAVYAVLVLHRSCWWFLGAVLLACTINAYNNPTFTDEQPH